jgi:microcystin-dependent protein
MDPFVAEIRIFCGNFAPKGWALCNGQLLPISQNTALFSLLGTMYGGDGKSTFGLPNLQASVPVHFDNSQFPQGSTGGVPYVTLLGTEMASHNHLVNASNQPGQLNAPGNDRIMARSGGGQAYQTNTSQNLVFMDQVNEITLTGGSQPHNNMQPYLGLTFIIALQGVYPPRT